MKILGIGNAIVDVICKVNDSFIEQNNLTKSTMKLFFDENEFKNLLTNLKIEKTVSGGSVANSIVGLSQLGDKVGFIGKVSDDEFGGKYEEGLKKENIKDHERYILDQKIEVLNSINSSEFYNWVIKNEFMFNYFIDLMKETKKEMIDE